MNTRILAVSVDSVHAARVFAEQLGISSFPLLGDLRREVCHSYGVLRADGYSDRVTYLIDRHGIVRHRAISDLDEERSIADYFIAIESLAGD